jgi:hypothetical protein
VVEGNNLRLALRYMMLALQNQGVPKMAAFAVEALLVCKEQLGAMPQYCQHLLQVCCLSLDCMYPPHPNAVADAWAGLQAPGVREQSSELAAFCEQALGKTQGAAEAGTAPPAVEAAALPAPEAAPDGPTAEAAAGGKAKLQVLLVSWAARQTCPPAGTQSQLEVVLPLQNGTTGPDVRLSPHTSLESTPFPSTPPGLSHSGVVGSAGSATPAQAVMDPNRAFQAINAETLEQASQDVDYPLPPQNVRSAACLPSPCALEEEHNPLTHMRPAGARQGGLHREQPEQRQPGGQGQGADGGGHARHVALVRQLHGRQARRAGAQLPRALPAGTPTWVLLFLAWLWKDGAPRCG